MRLLDLECRKCGTVMRDVFRRRVPKVIRHNQTDRNSKCGGRMDQVFLPNSLRNAGWSDRDAVVVFRKPDGSIAYPPRNDSPTPKGCERVTMRSLREVESFEKTNGVRCEAAHYNSGNGMEIIDFIETRPSFEQRERAFMNAWRG